MNFLADAPKFRSGISRNQKSYFTKIYTPMLCYVDNSVLFENSSKLNINQL